ncbi:MAG: hypothetical protein CL862_13850 [Cyanobium sp. NAT70]|nr:hypothetical protein [Cyanobium sp. NAT70]|tara:strand:- start:8002 stop:8742 length:741 start_codon:yes stop_codon:yes gene_type:complete
MKNILILGDSHLNAFKRGHDSLAIKDKHLFEKRRIDFSGNASHRLKFFSLNESEEKIYLRKNKKVSQTSKWDRARQSSEPLSLQQYDTFLITASSCRLDPNFLYGKTPKQFPLYSMDLLKQVIYSPRPGSCKDPKIVRSILEHYPQKTILIGQPLPDEKSKKAAFITTLNDRCRENISTNVKTIRSICAQEQPSSNPTIYLPPEHLLGPLGITTKTEYMMPPDDNNHANEAYGTKILLDLITRKLI